MNPPTATDHTISSTLTLEIQEFVGPNATWVSRGAPYVWSVPDDEREAARTAKQAAEILDETRRLLPTWEFRLVMVETVTVVHTEVVDQ